VFTWCVQWREHVRACGGTCDLFARVHVSVGVYTVSTMA